MALLAPAAAKSQTTDYGKYVNTFIGTYPLTDPKILGWRAAHKDWRSWAGLTFPGSSMPNAMVQLEPLMTELWFRRRGKSMRMISFMVLRIPIRDTGTCAIFLDAGMGKEA